MVREIPPAPPCKLWADVPPELEKVCLRALSKDPAARYPSAQAIGQEVSQWQEMQRKQAIEALRASEALYYSLVETLPINVWRKDANGRFVYANKGFCENTKMPLAQLIGKNDFDLHPKDLAEKVHPR